MLQLQKRKLQYIVKKGMQLVMKQYNPVTEEVVKALQDVVGEKYVKTAPDVLDVYKSDESLAPSYWRTPEVVVLPANTEEVAEIVKIANKYNVPVTPRSAGTSVSCCAVPVYHLSLIHI